ncbi:MAG: transcriptional regulator with XRE-family HTH domain [Paracoccaceae bacterium]|jgi:transcriptional regulator with XRE-family HTH domain
MTIIDKRDRSSTFRDRLAKASMMNGMSQSRLSRLVGVDRSTISQLLAGKNARLPNAQVVAECATALGVSADWLLGLTDRPERPGDVINTYLAVTDAARSSADEQINLWHHEAAGYKIRHVPATLPDILKTADMLTWEYGPQLARTTNQAIGAVDDNLGWFTSQNSDYEIAFPVHELESFARAEGYYRGLPLAVRVAQLDYLLELYEAHFPSLRLFLFDARAVYSAPITVFGPLLAVVYLGQHYIAFRENSRIKNFTVQFDGLVRAAVVDAKEIPEKLRQLKDEISGRSRLTSL